MNTLTRQEAEKRLKQIFKIDHFYDEQWVAIEKILKGERVLMIERTGFGKSLCYQFPATQFLGITIIFSPLIALMRDQVRNLNQKGISAAFINSEQTNEENSSIIEKAIQGKIKILYIAPERQENIEWIEATKQMNISMVVVDEAHTISTWGHDFRPAFRRIIDLVQLLPQSMPILATTATATKRVQQDIEQQIGGKITTIRGNLAENFATKFASTIKVPLSHSLTKTRETQEQKMFENAFNKKDNVKGSFDIDGNIVKGKTIILIDDICDSGATLKEIGDLLTIRGADKIVPIVIAKTVGGTL